MVINNRIKFNQVIINNPLSIYKTLGRSFLIN